MLWGIVIGLFIGAPIGFIAAAVLQMMADD